MHDMSTTAEVWDTAMRRAMEVAARSHAPFGSVICRTDRPDVILYEGANTTGSDPTGHAEVNALRSLANSGHSRGCRDFALISTAEPCPMCAAAAWWAEIGVVVFGTSIERLIRFGWNQIDMPSRELLAHGRGIESPRVIGPWREEWTDRLYRNA